MYLSAVFCGLCAAFYFKVLQGSCRPVKAAKTLLTAFTRKQVKAHSGGAERGTRRRMDRGLCYFGHIKVQNLRNQLVFQPTPHFFIYAEMRRRLETKLITKILEFDVTKVA